MSSWQQHTVTFAYEVGEEVVARLDGADVHSLDHGASLPGLWCPAWTIATVMEQLTCDDALVYVLRFRIRGGTYVTVVPEAAIEGVA